MSDIIITYRVIAGSHDVSNLARKIAIEQSVETPESLITKNIEEQFVGRIEDIRSYGNEGNQFSITLSYPKEILSEQYNQLINLCFGNVSMYRDVRLVDIRLPEDSLENFSGPAYGVEGIRASLGIYGRPLLATALKPRGCTDEQFANLAFQFAMGGGDIIKDDQNLIGDFSQFKNRVTLCLDALKKAEDKTGRPCLYFPFISAPFEQIENYFEWVKQKNITGVLLAPLILGLDTARGLASKFDLIYMAHPSFTGSYCVPDSNGMSYDLLYGTLFRLAGVDISVFPNTGGRFQFSEEDCKSIASNLRKPLGEIKPAFPCPAGGMQYDDLSKMCDWYGQDTVLLLGGSLLEYSSNLEKSTRNFKDKIAEPFSERIVLPSSNKVLSSCEHQEDSHARLLEYLECNNFQWNGRKNVLYKEKLDIPFRGIRRVELIGKQGEESKFDLRYFEIEKHGYSSKEKHEHVHVIIIARGEGQVIVDGKEYIVRKNDVLYVKPMAVHQLKNILSEPFGFYCIVDRDRDKPICV